MHELDLDNGLIMRMAGDSARGKVLTVSEKDLWVVKSDSYGTHMHRTWVFASHNGELVGTIERFWGGLKMICSVFGGSPRTNFFTEDGIRTTNKGLKSQQQ